MKISLDEIADWQEFEGMVAAYFRSIQEQPVNNLIDVVVESSGEGSDGGRDILLTFLVNDSIQTYYRKWVVQCKFYDRSLAKRHISDVNIPSLIHEYGADGYLLVCKSGATSKVTEMFESLRRNCKFNYAYEIWDGDVLKSKILTASDVILRRYFPQYFQSISNLLGKNIDQ